MYIHIKHPLLQQCVLHESWETPTSNPHAQHVTCLYTHACAHESHALSHSPVPPFPSAPQIESLLRKMGELKEELEKRPVVAQESSEAVAEKGPEQEESAPTPAKQPSKEQVRDLPALML